MRATNAGGTTYANGSSTAFWTFTTTIVPTPDFNGDGKPDLVFQNQTNGQMYAWFMGGANGTVLAGQSALPPTTTNWAVVSKDDFSGDGKSDLLWQDPAAGELRLWTMDGVRD